VGTPQVDVREVGVMHVNYPVAVRLNGEELGLAQEAHDLDFPLAVQAVKCGEGGYAGNLPDAEVFSDVDSFLLSIRSPICASSC